MKKKIISAVLAAVMIPASATGLFNSAAFAEKGDALDYLTEQKIVEGDENGDLMLDKNVTRAQFAKMAVLAFSLDNKSGYEQDFKDLDKSHWAYDYIMTACRYGLMDGFEDGTVRPDDYMTYEQAIKMATIRRYDYFAYPEGYIANALDYQCLDNIDASIGEYMTREDTMDLIYNTLISMENDMLSDEFEDKGKRDNEYEYDEADDELLYSYNTALADGAYVAEEAAPAAGGGGGFAIASGSSASMKSMPAPEANGAVLYDGGIYNPYINPFSNTEGYSSEEENIFKKTSLSPLSTFSIDTDTASYSNMRRFILDGTVPPKGSIRSEELINYFDYELEKPTDGEPFSVTTELSDCPWNEDNKLAMISVQGEEITLEDRQPQNLVFLIDVSGSMYSYNKLPLLKRSLALLLDKLDERDSISVVTYASGTEVKLSGVRANEKEKIVDCINSLRAGGATYGEAGLTLAYEEAQKAKIDGNNRIILCTDGDFNVGVSSNADLKDLVVKNRDNNIFLSILGFGTGNYKDDKLEIMADNGNGSYYYIDNLREAYKVFVTELTQTLYTIAKDVKIQVEFNPARVKEYRLIGYENRILNTEDFEDDTKDAGELGSGARVTALYELVTTENGETITGDDTLRYQTSSYSQSGELMDVKLRYKLPSETESVLKEYPVDADSFTKETSDNFRFASSVAELGMILNESAFKGASTYDSVIKLARGARGEDEYGFRGEFIQLVDLLRYIDKH